ncbi:GAF [Seminavis robusta]|uniref:GAF n=1 Tax=Seminavis robusta TaxID=568900 RepID=A0A9N8HIT5_9STRA|nr:GAF [Seminavis robusta]|eukprot:Sro808_g205420.1 GAF (649) ;mRNA; f:25119-27065
MPRSGTFRSVVDFDSNADDLRMALMNMNIQSRDDIAEAREGVDDQHTSRQHSTLSRSLSERTESTAWTTGTYSESDERTNEDERLDESWDWTLSDYDEERSEPQQISHEVKRLMNVQTFDHMIERDDDPTTASTRATLDRLTAMGQRLLKVPICAVNLMDIGRSYIMSNAGLGKTVTESGRKETWCNHTLQYKGDHMIVPDATKDWRFCKSPHVTGPYHLRFYASTPMVSPEGFRVGTFCVMGCEAKPNGFTEEETATFLDLGKLAGDALIQGRHNRRSRKAMEAAVDMVQAAKHDSKGLLQGIQHCLQPILLKMNKDPRSQEHRRNISSALSATDVVADINETTLAGVQGEASKSMSSTVISSCDEIIIMPQEKTKNDKIIIVKETLELLHNLMDPFPKGSPMVFSMDPKMPTSIITKSLHHLQRACLNMLRHACSKASKGGSSIHFRIAPDQNNNNKQQPQQAIFECRNITGSSGVGHHQTGEYFGEQKVRLSKKEEQNKSNNLSEIQLWPLASHVDSLGGSYGFQSPQSLGGEEGLASVWFKIPLIAANGMEIVQRARGDSIAKRRKDEDASIRPPLGPTQATSDGASQVIPDSAMDTTSGSNCDAPLVPQPGGHRGQLNDTSEVMGDELSGSRKRIKLDDSHVP